MEGGRVEGGKVTSAFPCHDLSPALRHVIM